MIRIDAMWIAAEPLDMRSGADRLLARVVQVFGSAQAYHGDLCANARGTRIKLLVHDGFGVWCAARRLNAGRFAGGAGDLDITRVLGAHSGAVQRTGPGPAVGAAARVEHHHAGLKEFKRQPRRRRHSACVEAIRACADALRDRS